MDRFLGNLSHFFEGLDARRNIKVSSELEAWGHVALAVSPLWCGEQCHGLAEGRGAEPSKHSRAAGVVQQQGLARHGRLPQRGQQWAAEGTAACRL